MVTKVALLLLRSYLATAILLRRKNLTDEGASAVPLEPLLTSVTDSPCSTIFLLKGDDAAVDLYQRLADDWWQKHYSLILKVTASRHNTNVTQQLHQLLLRARKVRQLSWCTTVVVVSHDPAFLAAFAEWSLRGRLLVWSTKLVVVTRLTIPQLRALLPQHWTFAMMNAIFFNVEGKASNTKCVVYTYLPYSPAGARLEQVATWTPRGGVHFGRDVLPFAEKFLNFYGATVNVTALPYMPFWGEEQSQAPDSSSVSRFEGSDYQLLVAVAAALNFTIRVLPCASWAEVIGKVQTRESFMCPVYHIIMTVRAKVHDYTVAYEYSHFSFAMAKPGQEPQWQSLYYPLSQQVWVAVAAALLVVPFIYTVVTYMQQKIHAGQPAGAGAVMLNMIGLMLGQSFSSTPSSAFSSRLLMASWLVFVVMFSWSYSGNLTASLTLPKYPTRPETLTQMVHAVDKVTIPAYGEDHYKFYRESDSPLFRSLAMLLEVGPELMEGFRGALKYKFTAVDGSSRLYVGRETLFPGAAGWPIPHDAPYKAQLDHHIKAVVESGLYEKWAADLLWDTKFKSRQRRKHSHEGEEEDTNAVAENKDSLALTITHMQGAFMLLLLGLIIATLVFVREAWHLQTEAYSRRRHAVLVEATVRGVFPATS